MYVKQKYWLTMDVEVSYLFWTSHQVNFKIDIFKEIILPTIVSIGKCMRKVVYLAMNLYILSHLFKCVPKKYQV